MKKYIDKIHSLNFRTKIVFSLALIGAVPFIILSMLLVNQTGSELAKNEEYSFNGAFLSAVSEMEKQIEKIENSIEVLSVDTTVNTVLTGEYSSEYEKYYQTTKHFDTILQTIMLTTPEIAYIEFFVPNSLAGVRINFHHINEFAEDPNGKEVEGGGWFYEDESFFLYNKIYSSYDISRYAVIKVKVNAKDLFTPDLVQGAFARAELRGVPIFSANISPNTQYVEKSTGFMDGQGSLDVYKPVNISSQTRGAMVMVVAGTAGGFLLLIAIINIVSAMLVKRLNRLNKQLSTAVQSGFKTALTEDYGDEIGQLTSTANKMIADTRRLIDDVYSSRLKQKEYEIKALQAQLNPHFLYNVLSAINWHAITSDNMEISGIVTSLSKFYRTALNKGESVISIKNEVENIEAYINIQLAIHSNSFDVIYDIDEKIYGYSMPNLVIQPIVENAIEHGLDHKTDGRGMLKISAEAKGKFISFKIINNGAPINEEDMDKLLVHKSSGYGLSNVNKRLKLFYGDDYELSFSSRDFTEVCLKMPKDINSIKKV